MKKTKAFLLAAFTVLFAAAVLLIPAKALAGGWGATVVLQYVTLDGEKLNIYNETELKAIIVTPDGDEKEATPMLTLHRGRNQYGEYVDEYGPEVFIEKYDEDFNCILVPGRYSLKDYTFPEGYELDETWGTGEGTDYPLYVDITAEDVEAFIQASMEEAGHEDFVIEIPVKKIGEASLAKTIPDISYAKEDKSVSTMYTDYPVGTAFHYEYATSKTGTYKSLDGTSSFIGLGRFPEIFKDGKTYYIRCRISKEIKGEEKYFDYCKPIEVKLPAIKIEPKQTTFSSLTGASKSIKLKWKKQTKNVDGYQIKYSTSSKMKSAKTVTIKKNSTVSTTIKKLSAKKKYYVQIRTYKKANGKTYYSDWSKAKSVTTKK